MFLILAFSFLPLAGFWIWRDALSPAKAHSALNQARRLFERAVPAPWSRTERDIATLQQYVRDKPNSAKNHTRLGQAYLQKARETGDPTYLSKAEGLFRKALELDPQNFEAMAGMGSLCLSRHQFLEALRWGEKGLAINPWSSELHGIVGDACVELGEYERAVRIVQKMVDLKPQLSSYSRVSYIRELHGDVDGAIEAMSMAVSSGAPNRENTAWCQVQLGNLYFNRGDFRLAELQYQMALKRLPRYVHALAGLARVRVAQDKLDEGLRLYEEVVAAMPLPEYVIALGDLYEELGKHDLAKHQFQLVRAMQDLYRASGVDADTELTLFQADHNFNTPQALEQAKTQFRRQPNVKAADALAWTLFKAGHFELAQSIIQQALKLGTKDPLLLFHAGMIYSKVGEAGKAMDYLSQVLTMNPHFSIRHAPEAMRTFDDLRAEAQNRLNVNKGAL